LVARVKPSILKKEQKVFSILVPLGCVSQIVPVKQGALEKGEPGNKDLSHRVCGEGIGSV
jgi:hypothetical protein